jgi:hypothetical protein
MWKLVETGSVLSITASLIWMQKTSRGAQNYGPFDTVSYLYMSIIPLTVKIALEQIDVQFFWKYAQAVLLKIYLVELTH